MNHSDIKAKMADYLDGDLALDERALFDGHLDGCDGCTHELAEMRTTIHLLRTLPTPEPPADLVDNVMRLIREGEATPSRLERFGEFLGQVFSPRFALPATAVAAGLAIVVVYGGYSLPLGGLEGAWSKGWQTLTPPADSARGGEARRDLIASRVPQGVATPVPSSEVPRVVIRQGAAPASGLRVGRGDTFAQGNPGSFFIYDQSRPLGPMQHQARADDLAFVSRPEHRGPYLGGSSAPQDSGGTINVSTALGEQRLYGLSPPGAGAGPEAGGAIPKDERRRIELDNLLGLLLENPTRFTRELAKRSLAEQELWLKELAARSVETGISQEAVIALRSSGTSNSQSLAHSFNLALEASRSDVAGLQGQDRAAEE